MCHLFISFADMKHTAVMCEIFILTETILAVHAGLKVLALSVISNLAAGVSDEKLDENEVLVTANAKRHIFADFVRKIISKIN